VSAVERLAELRIRFDAGSLGGGLTRDEIVELATANNLALEDLQVVVLRAGGVEQSRLVSAAALPPNAAANASRVLNGIRRGRA
jgi:hypothetical protein